VGMIYNSISIFVLISGWGIIWDTVNVRSV